LVRNVPADIAAFEQLELRRPVTWQAQEVLGHRTIVVQNRPLADKRANLVGSRRKRSEQRIEVLDLLVA